MSFEYETTQHLDYSHGYLASQSVLVAEDSPLVRKERIGLLEYSPLDQQTEIIGGYQSHR